MGARYLALDIVKQELDYKLQARDHKSDDSNPHNGRSCALYIAVLAIPYPNLMIMLFFDKANYSTLLTFQATSKISSHTPKTCRVPFLFDKEV